MLEKEVEEEMRYEREGELWFVLEKEVEEEMRYEKEGELERERERYSRESDRKIQLSLVLHFATQPTVKTEFLPNF